MADFSAEEIGKIYTKLTQHFLFNIYAISADIDVFVAFETMNNRGKPLSNLELLKNRLIFLSTRLGVDPIERQKVRSTVNESWKTVYHYLGRSQRNPIRDDLFLMIQCTYYYCDSLLARGDVDRAIYRRTLRMMHGDEEYFKQYLLETVFTSRNINLGKESSDGVSASSIYEYAHDLKSSVCGLYEVLNPYDSKFNDEQKILLTKLTRLASNSVEYLTLVLAAVTRSRKDDLTKFLRELERLLFFGSFGIMRGERVVFDPVQLVVGLRRGETSLDVVCAKITECADEAAKGLETGLLTAERYSRGFYTWKGVRYFLFEYEESLRLKAKAKREKIRWDEFVLEDFEGDYHTVEHVFPQRPERGEWPAFAKFAANRKQAMCNSLGNLVALSRPKNSQLGNHSFLKKCGGEGDDGTGYRVGSYSEIEIAKFGEWTPDAILCRGIRLLDFLEKRWRLTIGDESAKIRALNLEFLSKPSSSAKKRSSKR